MRINPIQFNFIQSKPQNTGNTSLRINNSYQSDIVSFKGRNNESEGNIFSEFWQFVTNTAKKIMPEDTPRKKMDKLKPKHKGLIYKKVFDDDGNIIKKIPVKVDIVKDSPSVFLFKKDKECLGKVILEYIPASWCSENFLGGINKNYKNLGIEGDRIKVSYVLNEDKDKYGGIGHLADLFEVACCKELGIKPKIISFSLPKAGPLHYKRGKRFVPYEQYCSDEQMKNLNLYGKDFNETVREIIEKTPEGEDYVVPPFGDIDFMPLMYMPEEMVKELEEELKEHPIF